MSKKFAKAWEYLNTCTYFTRPYHNSDGKVIAFSNELQQSLVIDVNKNSVYLECGSFSLDANCWQVDYNLQTKAKTFEKAIIKLYDKIYEVCGEDYIDDYFYNEDTKNTKDCFVKKDNGNYSFVSGSVTSYWDEEKLFEKIKSFS